jgi:outer membrane protein assembly factor BamB
MYKNLMLVGDFEGYIHAINPLSGSTTSRKKVSRKPIISIVTFRDLAYAIDQESNIFAIKL